MYPCIPLNQASHPPWTRVGFVLLTIAKLMEYSYSCHATGCFTMIDKKSELTAWNRKIPVRWNRCYFLHRTYAFWYLSSQKYHRQSVIILIWRHWRCIMVKIWKIHWKFKYSESQYCFANISAMRAWIFMKFYTVNNYYLGWSWDNCTVTVS